jgi:hypothetical protein
VGEQTQRPAASWFAIATGLNRRQTSCSPREPQKADSSLNLLNPRAWRLAFDTLRFGYAKGDSDEKLGVWLASNGYSAAFFDEWLLVSWAWNMG